MAIRSRKNQYVGVNAHLHSHLQNVSDGWDAFHGSHIVHIGENIDPLLPPGYFVSLKRSMQIREYEDEANDYPLMGIIIGKLEGSVDLGKPIVWIELLHPNSKEGGRGIERYISERKAILEHGVILIELDYLHQTPSVIKHIPSYPDREYWSYPYLAIVSNPQPKFNEGTTQVYGVSVDERMPIISIPLMRKENILLDLSKVYNYTYESLRYYSYHVDYEREPERFDTYSPADQQHIKQRMRTVWHYHQQGTDLEQGPFPLLED